MRDPLPRCFVTEGSHGGFWAALVVSLVYPSAAVALLYRLFRRRAMAG